MLVFAPTGLRPLAQGCCVLAATLGPRTNSELNPNGVPSLPREGRNPVGVEMGWRLSPRVVASTRQPWARRRSPVGANIRNVSLKRHDKSVSPISNRIAQLQNYRFGANSSPVGQAKDVLEKYPAAGLPAPKRQQGCRSPNGRGEASPLNPVQERVEPELCQLSNLLPSVRDEQLSLLLMRSFDGRLSVPKCGRLLIQRGCVR